MYPTITPNTFDPAHLMRSWTTDGFLVELYETGTMVGSHTAVGYRLYDVDYAIETGDASVVFEGTDYGVPSGQTIDGDRAVEGILGFLSLRPGDTDDEFFAGDTDRQTAWRIARGEHLGIYAQDGEVLPDTADPQWPLPDQPTIGAPCTCGSVRWIGNRCALCGTSR